MGQPHPLTEWFDHLHQPGGENTCKKVVTCSYATVTYKNMVIGTYFLDQWHLIFLLKLLNDVYNSECISNDMLKTTFIGIPQRPGAIQCEKLCITNLNKPRFQTSTQNYNEKHKKNKDGN